MNSSFFLTTVAAAAFGFFVLLRKLRFHEDGDEENKSPSSPPSCLSPSSVSPSAVPRIWTHQVFPSFRGEDVRKDLLSHIVKEFQRMGITSFKDNEISKGESIGPELIRAIRASKIAVILLSRNYASSSWCLDELVEIMKCKDELGQTVLVVFYEVSPSNVKKQTEDFGDGFRRTCVGKTKEQIQRWSQALTEVAQIEGFHSDNWTNEAEMIGTIVAHISNKLNNSALSNDFDGFVGMRAHLEKMQPLLDLDSEDVRMIGICGPPGIGKTTIARFVYNQLSSSFQLSAFMENLKGNDRRPYCSDDYGVKLQLQQQFMSQITKHKDIEVPHLGVARDRLKDKKALVVLDGVDHLLQLDAMAKETRWFGPGSRIIVTTQDSKLLKSHEIQDIYSVPFPGSDDALHIFCSSAFGQESPKDGFGKLARETTSLVGELPLALRVMGSYFRGMSKEDWILALPKLRNSIDAEIESILRFSFDALDEETQNLFLHIACVFKVSFLEMLEATLEQKLNVKNGLKVLAEKSLISIVWGVVRMPYSLQQLGENIVRKQSIRDLGHRQFLVDFKEICELLTDDSPGNRSSVEGICFRSSGEQISIGERAFQRMINLQFLVIYCSLDLPGGIDLVSHKLRVLIWHKLPLTCLTSNVNFELLVELELVSSKLEKLFEGSKSIPNLISMILVCSNLKELPDLSTAIKLRTIDLTGCSSLTTLPSTIGNATNLRKLILRHCSNLITLPESIGNAINLRTLDLCGCSSLTILPSSIVKATSLETLNLHGCSNLTDISFYLKDATNLRKLNLRGCSKLMKGFISMGKLPQLQLKWD